MSKPFAWNTVYGAMACVLTIATYSPLRHHADKTVVEGSFLPRIGQHDSIPLSTITTDTGALAPGNKDFSRFTNPGMCVGAAGIASDLRRLTFAAQVVHVFQDSAIRGDTLPTGAVTVARACGSHFTVAGVAKRDLSALFKLALMMGNDTLARDVVRRRVALASDTLMRAAVLQEAIDAYLDAEPSRVAAAEAVVQQMDSLGSRVAAVRLKGHQSLLYFAFVKFNEPYMERQAREIIAIGQSVPTQSILYVDEPIIYAYAVLGQIAYLEHPDSVLAIMARAKQDLRRFPTGPEFPPGTPYTWLQLIDFKTITPAGLRNKLVPFNAEQYDAKPLPPLFASYWFPKAPASWPPGDGRPSLIIYGGYIPNGCARYDDRILQVNVEMHGMYCWELYTYLPKWLKQYGNRLSITLVSQISPLYGRAARSMIIPAAAQADSLRWFFQDELKLPITLGVVVDSVWHLKAIDGRAMALDTSFYGALEGRVPPNFQSNLIVMLYGEHGKLQYLGGFEEHVLQRLLDREMGVAPSAPYNPEKP